MGHCSCTYRTLIAGRQPNDREKDWYKKLLDRMNNIIDAIRPGTTTADVAKHFAPASEPGMAIAIESLEGEYLIGGVRLEDMVIVIYVTGLCLPGDRKSIGNKMMHRLVPRPDMPGVHAGRHGRAAPRPEEWLLIDWPRGSLSRRSTGC